MIKERRLLIFCYTLGILSLIIYGEFIIHFHATITTYMIFVLFLILLSFQLFIAGIICNKKENYRKIQFKIPNKNTQIKKEEKSCIG